MKKSKAESNLEKINHSSIYFDDIREILMEHQLLRDEIINLEKELIKAERSLCCISWAKSLDEAKSIAEEALREDG